MGRFWGSTLSLILETTVERHWHKKMSTERTCWRVTGSYLPTLASKSSLIEESRLFLDTYAQLGDPHAALQALVDGVLPQRSRETRETIVLVLRRRLVRWDPPSWVLADLASFAQDTHSDALPLALLLHIARQDGLLYDFVQQVIVQRWYSGTPRVIRSDVQGFLDKAQDEHPEIIRWSHSTREKISGNVLTVLRDCRLLKGEVNKYIVMPTVSTPVVLHMIHLLEAEGVTREQLAQHPDWHLWLWDSIRAQKAIDFSTTQEYLV